MPYLEWHPSFACDCGVNARRFIHDYLTRTQRPCGEGHLFRERPVRGKTRDSNVKPYPSGCDIHPQRPRDGMSAYGLPHPWKALHGLAAV